VKPRRYHPIGGQGLSAIQAPNVAAACGVPTPSMKPSVPGHTTSRSVHDDLAQLAGAKEWEVCVIYFILRHCERSEAIHSAKERKNGWLRRFVLAMTGQEAGVTSSEQVKSPSWQ